MKSRFQSEESCAVDISKMEFRGPPKLIRTTVLVGTIATVASLVLLYLDVSNRLASWDDDTVVWLDTALCLVMMAEWFILLKLCDDKWAFVRARWIDLLASLPLLLLLRPFRVVRLIRLLRLLRGIALMQKVLRPWQAALDTTLLKSALMTIVVMILACALMVMDLERNNPHLDEFNEALWWAIVTATTVGYGDRYPLTGGGQVVATLLMIIGVGMFGTLAASLTSAFIPKRDGVTNAQILQRLRSLEDKISQLVDQSSRTR